MIEVLFDGIGTHYLDMVFTGGLSWGVSGNKSKNPKLKMLPIVTDAP